MKIVCGASVLDGPEAFATLGDVTVLPDREIGPADVRDADLLAIRSQTRADAALLEGSRVRFVGTATAGTDHLDTAFFERAGISWSGAPGCNANSVAEYIAAALLTLAGRHRFRLEGKTLGIIGVGHVGSRTAAKAGALGLRVLGNDPPREAAGAAGLFPLDRVLAESDLLTLHVPLNDAGPWPTRRLADAAFFERLKTGAVFLNASRGGVTDQEALLRALDEGRVARAVLDVWEGEPAFSAGLLERVDLGTPHIAGYSVEGKLDGTVQIYRAACASLGVEPLWKPAVLAPLDPLRLGPGAGPEAEQKALRAAVRTVYDIEADDGALRAGGGGTAEERAAHFTRLRKQYPARREFAALRVETPGPGHAFRARLDALGFG